MEEMNSRPPLPRSAAASAMLAASLFLAGGCDLEQSPSTQEMQSQGSGLLETAPTAILRNPQEVTSKQVIAFVASKQGRRSVWVVEPDGAKARKVSAENVGDEPRWSKGGGKLYYASSDSSIWEFDAASGKTALLGKVAGHDFDVGATLFARIDRDTATLRLLDLKTRTASDHEIKLEGKPRAVGWLEEGARLFVLMEDPKTLRRQGGVETVQSFIYMWDLKENKGARLFDRPVSACFPSPNLRRVLLEVVDDESVTLTLLDLEKKTQSEIARKAHIDLEPAWSRDGKKIAYVGHDEHGNGENDLELYVVDVESKVEKQVTKNDVADYFPSWSPDSKRIAFEHDEQIAVVDLDSQRVTIIVNKGDGQTNSSPRWGR